ncbi:FAD-dependent oxidoreductase, partial [Nocardioides sp.]|uniref:GcvT family protein n=1 Tax=Nocardioides sp. TaxID=35761 RepID=UPI0027338948
WGIESELVSPEFVKEKVPFLEADQIIGAFWTPSVGVVDSLRAGTIMRERALEAGVLTVVPTVEVTGLDTEEGARGRRRITRVRTTGGDIEAETVVIACGVWIPKIGDMAGISIPLTPAVHQIISVGPCPQLEGTEGEITFPIVRDMDTFCYERQHGADMEVGSYAHRAILHEPEDIPSIEQAKLSPTEMPFTSDDFDPQLEQAYELMPELLGAEGAEMRYAINGLLSLTCDGAPILGESEVDGLWSAAAVWIKEGPGVARAVAETMTQGWSEIDIHHSDIARFHPHQQRREHTRLRTTESFIKTYGIVHPSEQYESDREQRLSPMYESQKKLGAFFYETAGWERPHWYESNAHLLDAYGDAVMPREHEWDARWWSPIINAEHLRMREAAGVIDLTAFCMFDIVGPGALESVQRTCVAQCDVAVGKVIYTPVLNARGGFLSDLTVMRLGEDHFRVVTGGAHGMADRKWFTDQLVDDGATTLTDLTNDVSTIGLWGPRARDILASLVTDDVSDSGFGFLTCREIDVNGIPVLASRISYVGELGWELYVSMDQASDLWEALLEAGSTHGAVPVGIGVYGTTGRIEKGYRSFGAELDAERTIIEAGMQRPKVKKADFIGKEAYLAQRETAPVSVLCTLTVDDHTSASGVKRYMLGGEPILTRDGGTLTDGHGHHPYVTSAGSAPSLGKHVLMAYLPPDQATVGNQLAVSYMEELYPVTVGSVDATALLDPTNERIR